MTNKRKTITASIVAGLFAVTTLAMFGISGETVIEMDYNIVNGETVTSMEVYPPEEMSVDIIELYCNGEFVTRTLLPNGKLQSIPFVFTDVGNLELRFYKLSECIGIGNFKDKILYVAVKDNMLPGTSYSPIISEEE